MDAGELAKYIAHIDCGDDAAAVTAFDASAENLKAAVQQALSRGVDPYDLWSVMLASDAPPVGLACAMCCSMFPGVFPPGNEEQPRVGSANDVAIRIQLLRLHRMARKLLIACSSIPTSPAYQAAAAKPGGAQKLEASVAAIRAAAHTLAEATNL